MSKNKNKAKAKNKNKAQGPLEVSVTPNRMFTLFEEDKVKINVRGTLVLLKLPSNFWVDEGDIEDLHDVIEERSGGCGDDDGEDDDIEDPQDFEGDDFDEEEEEEEED